MAQDDSRFVAGLPCPNQSRRRCSPGQSGFGSQSSSEDLHMKTQKQTTTTKRRNALATYQGVSNETPSLGKDFALEIRVRGKSDYLHEELCHGLEDAIRIGEKWFRAFQARNPWFVQDSKRKRIFILLDPETESLLRL